MKLPSPSQLTRSTRRYQNPHSPNASPVIKLRPVQKWIIGIAIAIVGTMFAVSININDSAFDLLPGNAVRGDLQLLEKLGFVDRIIISLSVDDNPSTNHNPEAIGNLKKSSIALGKHLEDSKFFTNVVYHLPKKFELQTYLQFQPILPLLLDSQDLHLLEPLTEPTGIEKSLQKSFNLLNSPAGYGIKQQIQSDPLGITSIFLNKLEYLKAGYSLVVEDGLFLSKDRKSCLIIAESTMELTDADSATVIHKVLTKTFQTVLLPGITPRVIGSLPHTLANANAVKHDLKKLLPVATLLLLSLLFLALKNIRALLVLAIPFLAAPSAIGVTGMIFGEISALALGFGIVLLGIAIDFSIHLYLGLAGTDQSNSFLKHIRKPILLATLTTASVFIVLLFSDVPSHRQMATLALSGIVLAVLYSWYLVPLIVPKIDTVATKTSTVLRLSPTPFARRCILLCWTILLLAGIMSWPGLKYNGNLQNLDAPIKSVIEAEDHFRKTWGDKGEQAFVVASATSLDEALQTNYFIYNELQKFDNLSFQSIAPILPSLTDQSNNRENWQKFWQTRMLIFSPLFHAKAAELGFSDDAFLPFFESLNTSPDPDSLFENLPEGLKILANAMIRPPDQQRGSNGNNTYLVTTTVSTDENLFTFLLDLDNRHPNITLLANKKWRNQVENLLRRDIVTLSLAAAAIISFIVFLSFRNIRITIAVLAPVISALSAMAIFSSATGRELNMMHLLMGIMVIGLAVDYGIFSVCSLKKKSDTTSLLAISVCAMSSLIGFGVLSFAQHPALNSLGVTVLIGIGAAWPTAILVSPALMQNHLTNKHKSVLT